MPAAKAVAVDESGTSAFARRIRSPAVAGVLYPADARELSLTVGSLLACVPRTARRPKALIVPHGSLRHSGELAAHAFAALTRDPEPITRVVLAGPAHRRDVHGIVVPDSEAFATPLGTVPIDVAGRDSLLALPCVRRDDVPHRREHALEVQLPFLQLTLDRFALLPMLVGGVPSDLVAAALRRVWGGAETLVVVTSDLSQHRPYAEAQRLDRATAARIVRGEPGLDRERACGSALIDALLVAAAEHGLEPVALGLANSGDTGGDATRVVGYGAFGFY
jgi:AmmeMemoRadiSam system protein B